MHSTLNLETKQFIRFSYSLVNRKIEQYIWLNTNFKSLVWTYDLVLDKLAQEDVYYHICDLIFTRVEWSQPVIFHFFKPRRNERVTNKSMIEAMYTTINMRKPRRQRRWTSAVDVVNSYSNGFLYISIVESITDILIEIF